MFLEAESIFGRLSCNILKTGLSNSLDNRHYPLHLGRYDRNIETSGGNKLILASSSTDTSTAPGQFYVQINKPERDEMLMITTELANVEKTFFRHLAELILHQYQEYVHQPRIQKKAAGSKSFFQHFRKTDGKPNTKTPRCYLLLCFTFQPETKFETQRIKTTSGRALQSSPSRPEPGRLHDNFTT